MTCRNNTPPTRYGSARFVTGVALSAILAFGTFASSASADDHRGHDRGHERHDNRGHGDWGGSYYSAPPVVYGSPYYAPGYYPPPVVYGPSVGINLPGVSIGIR